MNPKVLMALFATATAQQIPVMEQMQEPVYQNGLVKDEIKEPVYNNGRALSDYYSWYDSYDLPQKVVDMLKVTPVSKSSEHDWDKKVELWKSVEAKKETSIITEMESDFMDYMNPVVSSTEWAEDLDVTIFFIATYWKGPYTGQVKNNVPHGVGRLVDEVNNLYEGQFVDGKLTGFMRLVNSDSYTVGKYDEGKPQCFTIFDTDGSIISQKKC